MVNKIKKIRQEKGITQAELAKQIGVAQNTLSYWENGKYDVDNASLKKIADYFQVSTDYLLGRDEIKTPAADDELTEYLEQLKTRPELKMLFSVTKGATKEEIEKAVKIIEALLK